MPTAAALLVSLFMRGAAGERAEPPEAAEVREEPAGPTPAVPETLAPAGAAAQPRAAVDG